MKLQRDLREFVALLNSHDVEYLVVGAHAVAFHGYPRYTGDLDLFVRASSDNAARLRTVLDEFGFSEVAAEVESAVSTPGMVVQLGHPPNRIDLLTSISAIEFDHAWRGSIHGLLDDLPVRIIALADLIRNKKASGRPKDLADAAELLNVHRLSDKE